MTRRAHGQQPHLHRFDGPRLFRALVDLDERTDLNDRARLLARFELLTQEFSGETVGEHDGLRRPAWQLGGEWLEQAHRQGRLVAEIEADAEDEFPLALAEFETRDIDAKLEQLEGRLGEYDPLRSRPTDTFMRVYVWPDGTHLAFQRHRRTLDRWRFVRLNEAELEEYRAEPAKEIRPTPPRVPGEPEPEARPGPSAEFEEVSEQLGRVGLELQDLIRAGAEHLDEERLRLDVEAAHAMTAEDVPALRRLVVDATRVVETEQARQAELARRVAERQQELERQGEVDLPPDDEDVPGLRVLRGGDEEHAAEEGETAKVAVPECPSEAAPTHAAGGGPFPTPFSPPPAAPIQEPAPRRDQTGDEEGAVSAPAPDLAQQAGSAPRSEDVPACVDFESARDAAERGAADITDPVARQRALEAVSACATVEQVHGVMRRILANLAEQAKLAEKNKRARQTTLDYVEKARAAHAENAAKARTEKPESALNASRRRVRGAGMESAKVDPAVKELRAVVLELAREVFAPGTPPRDLVDAIKDADYQALTLQRAQLEKQAEEKRKRLPAPVAEVDLRGVLPQEGE